MVKMRTVEWGGAILTVRAANCLNGLGCGSLEDAQRFTRRQLMETPNLGKGTLKEITGRLAERGVTLEEGEKPQW